MTGDARTRAALAGILILHLGWGAAFVHRTSFETPDGRVFSLWDDAMISMHYARHLAEGHGLVWNVGEEPIQGFSNLGVALLMAALHLLPTSATRVSLLFQVLNLAMLTLVLLLVFRLAGRLAPGRPGVALGAVAATALSGPLAIWSLLGSDMGLVTAWLMVGVLAVAAAEDGERSLAPVFVALGPGLWLRPDAIVFYALLLGGALALPAQRRAVWAGVATAAVFGGAWLALGAVFYGDPLPNTYYLKATGHPRSAVLARGVELVGVWLPRLALPIALAAFATWRRRERATPRLCAAVVVASIGYSLWVGGDWMASHGVRFMVPMLPLLLVLMAAGVDDLATRVLPGPARAPAALAATALLAVLANAPATVPEWLGARVPDSVGANRSNYFFATYVARHTDPSTSLGVHWAGVPIYFSRRPAVDVLGRSDRHIARLSVDEFRPGHSKWDWDYVVNARRPDLIREATRGLGERDDFRRAYVRVSKRGRDFFLRRDAIGRLEDSAVAIYDLRTGRRVSRQSVESEGPPSDAG